MGDLTRRQTRDLNPLGKITRVEKNTLYFTRDTDTILPNPVTPDREMILPINYPH